MRPIFTELHVLNAYPRVKSSRAQSSVTTLYIVLFYTVRRGNGCFSTYFVYFVHFVD